MVTRDLIERLTDGAAPFGFIARQAGADAEPFQSEMIALKHVRNAYTLLTEAASALQGKDEEIARLEGELASRDLSPATCAATPKSAAPDLGVAEGRPAIAGAWFYCVACDRNTPRDFCPICGAPMCEPL